MTQVSLNTLVQAAISGTTLVSFPTDTVPALATRPNCAELIFVAKRRRFDKPLILMAAAPTDLWPYVLGTPQEMQIWQQVAQQYWPGPLTLVLPASSQVPAAMNPTNPTTIGIRIPNCRIARQILQQTGPLATTSANLSGQPPLTTLAEIEAQFPEVLTLLPSELPEIPQASGVPSTVAKWKVSGGWEILRQGAIKLKS